MDLGLGSELDVSFPVQGWLPLGTAGWRGISSFQGKVRFHPRSLLGVLRSGGQDRMTHERRVGGNVWKAQRGKESKRAESMDREAGLTSVEGQGRKIGWAGSPNAVQFEEGLSKLLGRPQAKDVCWKSPRRAAMSRP